LNTVELMRVSSSGLNMGPHHAMMIAEKWVFHNRCFFWFCRLTLALVNLAFRFSIPCFEVISFSYISLSSFCSGFTLRATSVTLGPSLPSTTRTLTLRRFCVSKSTTPTGGQRFESCSHKDTSNRGKQTIH
jgi:hypothetical protein